MACYTVTTNCLPDVSDNITAGDRATGLDELEDLSSEIMLKFSETTEKTSGFLLNTTKTGHFIKYGSEINIPLDLNLQDNDRLLAINDKTIIYWNHWLVLECLKYLLYFAEQCEKLSIIIDRQADDGTIDIYEICIQITRSRGDAYLEIKSLLKRITYIPRMRSVKFKDLYQCRIRHGARPNCYMKVNADRKLVMETLNNKDEDIWQFDCYIYKALSFCKRPDQPPSTVFICVLRSCHSFDGKQPYIMAKNCEKVGVTFFRTLELDDSRTESTDPRFFRVTKTANGLQMFESLIYRNYYLSWVNLSEKLKLAKHTKEEISAFADSLDKCQFEILSDRVTLAN